MDIQEYKWVGLMSGTSLDGLDMVYVEFQHKGETWDYTLGPCQTLPYSSDLVYKLENAHLLDGKNLISWHLEYGKILGKMADHFIKTHQLAPNGIASHGHTIFHQPSEGISFQLGHGAAIHAITGIKTISDFRTLDVMLGGQGAPLVPVGDRMLFSNYDACLNLGGISNISFEYHGQTIAFDISPCNMVLNKIIHSLNMSYDDKGKIARSGRLIPELLDELNRLSYYTLNPPKSLGREWVEETVMPLINKYNNTVADILHTVCEHIASEIAKIINQYNLHHILVTGGGAYHDFLLELLDKHSPNRIEKGANSLIDFKEAIVFAFLGMLKSLDMENTYQSVTGAKRNSSGGMIC